jgi:hypothetical protein
MDVLLGLDSWQGQGREFSLLPLCPLPTQRCVQWLLGVLTIRVEWPGCEADHLPPPSAEVKNVWMYTSTPPVCPHGMVLSCSGTALPFYLF